MMSINAELEKLFAGRWIAGCYPEDAIKRSRLFNSRGISTMINFLGEEKIKKEEIRETFDTYIQIIKMIRKEGLDSSISIKPTEIGLSVSYQLFLSNYLKLSKFAKKNKVFVWLDMEASEDVDSTIKGYEKAIEYGNTGICIQAYLKRSESDIARLIKKGAKIRLVKGAYNIKSDAAFKTHSRISHNYKVLMLMLFQRSKSFMIATHDSRIIDEAIQLNRKYGRDVTYSMLNGIRNKYALYLARNQKVAVYIPFGSDWISYGYRRLIEQRHLSLILRSLLNSQSID